MPIAEDVKSSWADEVELEGGALPPPSEVRENGLKIVTEYKLNEENKKQKIVRTYKTEKRIVSKTIAMRKTWPKFGLSANDKPGPNPSTTIVGEDVYMQFITSKEEENKPEEDVLDKLKTMAEKVVKCRVCTGDHWTTKCPWKDTGVTGGKIPEEKKPIVPEQGKPNGSKYVIPSLRDGGSKRAENSSMQRRDDTTAIRITNLSDSTREKDLEELVQNFGPIHKLFLAKDKVTEECKGFAYVHFKYRQDAAKAIQGLNGHGYDHLILSVDWSKPLSHSN